MGWSGGSAIFGEIIDALVEEVKNEKARETIYERLIPVFLDEDCDTMDECLGQDPAFDLVWKAYYAEEDEPDDEWDDDDLPDD